MSAQKSKEVVATQKLIWRLAFPDEDQRLSDDVDVFDAVDAVVERIAALEEENERLRERISEVESDTQMALDASGAVDSGVRADGGPTKKKIAGWKSRNELIVQAAERPDLRNPATGAVVQNNAASVDVGKVQEMARPEDDLKWQTVVDAWTTLEKNWACFKVENPDGGKKQLRLVEDPPETLVRMVETDLDRDDLVKRLVDGRE